MRNFIFLLVVLCLFILKTSGQNNCKVLVWADEFNGTSLDRTKWTPEVDGSGGGNGELQYYADRPENIQVSSGTLKIIAKREAYLGKAYTSARLNTKNLADFQYGSFEARMKLPVIKGIWPAFWMLPTENYYGVWPLSGELDIMELIGTDPKTVWATPHTHKACVHVWNSKHYTLTSGTFADAFHVFKMDWSPDTVKFYTDNVLYQKIVRQNFADTAWVYDKPFHVLLNLAVGGQWPGSPDPSPAPFPDQIMEVDYVRVYQLKKDIQIKGTSFLPFCSTVNYSVPALSSTTYRWLLPSNTSFSGQNTAAIQANWKLYDGTIKLAISDGCGTDTVRKAVTLTNDLFENGNFENGFAAWKSNRTNNTCFNIVTTAAPQGSKYASIQVPATTTNPWDIQLSRAVPLTSAVSYTLSFKARANNTTTQVLNVSFIRSDNFSLISQKQFTLNTTWQTITHTFTSAQTAAALMTIVLGAAARTYEFDDFQFSNGQSQKCNCVVESVQSGAWESTSTWTCARIPTANDIVIVKNPHVVTAISDVAATEIHSLGEFRMQNKARILPTILVLPY